MQKTLESLIEQIDTKKSEIIKRTLAINEADQNTPPVKGGWSPVQVVEHLIIFEEWLFAGRKKAVEAGASLKPGFKGKLFTSVVRLMIGTKARFGTMPEFEPTGEIDLTKRMADWSALRQSISKELESIDSSQLQATFAIHPIAGPIDSQTTLELISLHLDYHLRNFPDAPGTGK